MFDGHNGPSAALFASERLIQGLIKCDSFPRDLASSLVSLPVHHPCQPPGVLSMQTCLSGMFEWGLEGMEDGTKGSKRAIICCPCMQACLLACGADVGSITLGVLGPFGSQEHYVACSQGPPLAEHMHVEIATVAETEASNI